MKNDGAFVSLTNELWSSGLLAQRTSGYKRCGPKLTGLVISGPWERPRRSSAAAEFVLPLTALPCEVSLSPRTLDFVDIWPTIQAVVSDG
jgi:hypothetical protein